MLSVIKEAKQEKELNVFIKEKVKDMSDGGDYCISSDPAERSNEIQG